MSANDFARRAIIHFLRAVESCHRCTLGVDCGEHGKAIEPDAAPSADDKPIEGFNGIVGSYHELYKKHRGVAPIYTDADFAAFRRLALAAGGADEAVKLVRMMFAKAGYCQSEMTIQTLARNPSMVQGEPVPRGGPSTIQGGGAKPGAADKIVERLNGKQRKALRQ